MAFICNLVLVFWDLIHFGPPTRELEALQVILRHLFEDEDEDDDENE